MVVLDNRIARSTLALYGLLAWAVCSAQTVVYQQPSTFTPPNGTIGGAALDSSAAGIGAQSFDSFTLSKGATITTVRWFGYPIDDVNLGNNPVPPGATSWEIDFFSDVAGAPGVAISSMTLPASSVVATKLGSPSNISPTVNLYQFDAVLPTPFVASAGVKYWFSAASKQAASNPVFYWINGTGGDSKSVIILTPGGATPGFFDLAFTLFAADQTDVFQVRYAANLSVGDSMINITNTGTLNGNDPAGRLCANIYVFDPNEEPVSCCSCPVTPNGVVSLSARNSLIANPLTPGVPTSIVIKVLFTQAGPACDAGTVNPDGSTLARGGLAWATTLHLNTSTSPATTQLTETPFAKSELSASELAKLTSVCNFIETYASKFGLCKGCSAGALGARRSN